MRTLFLFAPVAIVALIFPSFAQAQRDRTSERRVERGANAEQAIERCKDSIREEAHQRFGNAAVNFRQTDVDNNPGRNDWIIGTVAVKTSRWRPSEAYRFSCSVDFSTGRVRNAHIGVPNY
jgi:hypothetical protein